MAAAGASSWDRLLAPDAVYIDENGAIMPRARDKSARDISRNVPTHSRAPRCHDSFR
jgi:hypothetical protein